MSDNDEWYDLLMKMSFSLWPRSWEDKYLPRWLLERSTTSEESGKLFRWGIKAHLCLSVPCETDDDIFISIWNRSHFHFHLKQVTFLFQGETGHIFISIYETGHFCISIWKMSLFYFYVKQVSFLFPCEKGDIFGE